MSALDITQQMNRRHFLQAAAGGLGAAALGTLASPIAQAATHFAPRAKRVIYLFQSGGPVTNRPASTTNPPSKNTHDLTDLPESVRMGQRLTGMTANQAKFPVAQSMFKFDQHGESGAQISELLPYTAGVADDLCIIRSM